MNCTPLEKIATTTAKNRREAQCSHLNALGGGLDPDPEPVAVEMAGGC
jgi:hypothetical protein